MRKYKLLTDNLNVLLKLQREIIGIKLVYSKEEFKEYSGVELKKPMAYCVAVKAATKGHAIKLTRTTGGCAGSNRALGLTACNTDFMTGISGCNLGLYKDTIVAASVACDEPRCEDKTYGVIIKPLDMYEKDPDVVLIFANTRESMRIMQGYTFINGLAKYLNMSGNQAVCVEATVAPLKTQDINVSLLCSGTRYRAKWSEGEVLTGIPFGMVQDIIEGLKGTVNAVEEDHRKQEIEVGLLKTGSLDFEINYGKTYYKTWKKEEKQ